DKIERRNSLKRKTKAVWELCPPPGPDKKVPDEDPLPCGGTEKLRDEKFKWKPGDVMEFIGSCRSSLALRHPKMKDFEEDEGERMKLAIKDMTKEYRKKMAEEEAAKKEEEEKAAKEEEPKEAEDKLEPSARDRPSKSEQMSRARATSAPPPKGLKRPVRVRPVLEREVEHGSVARAAFCLCPKGCYHGCVALAHERVYLSTEEHSALTLAADVSAESNADKPVLIGSKDDPVPDGIKVYPGFDGLIDQDSSQEEAFAVVGQEAVDGVLLGLNAAIMAYGQTSTGKTHTMVGDKTRPGLCLKAAGHLFSEAGLQGSQIEVQASFLQLYLNHITDLLVPNGHEKKLKLREVVEEDGVDTKVEGFLASGLSERPVESMDDVAALIDEGNQRRQQACTALNAHSSRSHAILILNVTLWQGTLGGKDEEATEAKLYLVDLAGSERVKDSCAVGDRFTEAVHINKSLFALQGVVAALADGKPHIPYRNDPLTQLSLSGIADSLQLSPRILGAVKLGSSHSNPSTLIQNVDAYICE
ncbi:unnamed protein product, partial [Effrenium voratum]